MATATAIPARRLISVDGLCALFEALVADGYHVIGPSGVLGRVPSEPTPAATVRRARSAVEGQARLPDHRIRLVGDGAEDAAHDQAASRTTRALQAWASRAVLRSPAGTEETRCGFLAGCDGPASVVRAQAGIGWPGRAYPVEVRLGVPPAGWPVHVHRLASAPGRSLTAVRPDGYIGFRGQVAEVGQLAAWLALIGAGSGIAGEWASPGPR